MIYADNYEFEDRECGDIGGIIEQLVIKNREHRMNLEMAYEELLAIINQ